MTFHASGFRSLATPIGIPSATSEPGNVRQWHTYITNDDLATIETSGYFDALLTPTGKVRNGDMLDVVYDVDGTPGRKSYTLALAAGVLSLRAAGDDSGAGVRAITATSDGLTTGLIRDSDTFVEVTSANANNIVTLPTATAATRGREIWIWVLPSTNCELRTPASSNQTINNVDSDGSAEALLTHSQLYICRQHLATGWLLQAFTALGAVATAIIPD